MVARQQHEISKARGKGMAPEAGPRHGAAVSGHAGRLHSCCRRRRPAAATTATAATAAAATAMLSLPPPPPRTVASIAAHGTQRLQP